MISTQYAVRNAFRSGGGEKKNNGKKTRTYQQETTFHASLKVTYNDISRHGDRKKKIKIFVTIAFIFAYFSWIDQRTSVRETDRETEKERSVRIIHFP